MDNEKENEQLIQTLETMKDFRTKTQQLEKIRNLLKQEVSKTEQENEYAEVYKSELNLLYQEKLAHVEELRQIHADIDSMDTVLKDSKEARFGSYQKSKCLFEELLALKSTLDNDRLDLGMELTQLDEEIRMGTEFFEKYPQQWQDNDHEVANSNIAAPTPKKARSALFHEMEPLSVPLDLGRQNPPPMKACMSCHQLIHRNAPICPLCKAKSRSRNPKKQKKDSK